MISRKTKDNSVCSGQKVSRGGGAGVDHPSREPKN
jgi:hypothetical protein